MKGMWSSFTTLIILVATVFASLVVVFYAYSMLGAQNQSVIVTQAFPGIIKDGQLYVFLQTNSQIKIVKLLVEGYCEAEKVCLKPGLNNVSLTLPSGFSPSKCEVYSFTLVLCNGKSVIVNAKYYC
ncbi:MAG: hypothetical protein RXQ75_07755 [Acidianus hospitalis]